MSYLHNDFFFCSHAIFILLIPFQNIHTAIIKQKDGLTPPNSPPANLYSRMLSPYSHSTVYEQFTLGYVCACILPCLVKRLLLLSGILCTVACKKYSKQGNSQSNVYSGQTWKLYQLSSPTLFTTSLLCHVITFGVYHLLCLTLNVYVGKLWEFYSPNTFDDFKACLIKPRLTD